MHPFDIIIISKSYRKIIIKNEVKKLRLGALKSKLEPFSQSCYIPFSCFVLCRYLDEAGVKNTGFTQIFIYLNLLLTIVDQCFSFINSVAA